MVKAINDSRPNWLCYGQIIEDIKLSLGSLRCWTIRHVKREANLVAHGLAKNATRNFDIQVWLEEPPSCILDVILEQLALFL
jgi:hypothetical protein